MLHPTYSTIARTIFELYLYQNLGIYKITQYLNEHSIPTPRAIANAKNAGTLWLQSSVSLILTNPIYTGNMVQNRSKKINLSSNKRTQIPEENQIVVPNTHEPIITRKEFNMVQDKLMRRGKSRSNGQENLFAHIARCADCGRGMHYRKDRNGYICGTYSKHGKKHCTSHLIKSDVLLNTVKSELSFLSTNTVNVDALVKKFSPLMLPKTHTLKNELSQTQKKIETLIKRQTTLLDLLTDGSLTREEWNIQNNVLKKELSVFQTKELEIKLSLNETKDIENNLNALKKEIQHIITLDLEDEHILKILLNKLIARIEVSSDGTPKIYYNFQNPGA